MQIFLDKIKKPRNRKPRNGKPRKTRDYCITLFYYVLKSCYRNFLNQTETSCYEKSCYRKSGQ